MFPQKSALCKDRYTSSRLHPRLDQALIALRIKGTTTSSIRALWMEYRLVRSGGGVA